MVYGVDLMVRVSPTAWQAKTVWACGKLLAEGTRTCVSVPTTSHLISFFFFFYNSSAVVGCPLKTDRWRQDLASTHTKKTMVPITTFMRGCRCNFHIVRKSCVVCWSRASGRRRHSVGTTVWISTVLLGVFTPQEPRSCVKVEVAVLGSSSLIVFMVSVDVNQHWTRTKHTHVHTHTQKKKKGR